MIPESVDASRETDPPEVTAEWTMSAVIAWVITLPETVPLTATLPDPDTLTMTARMFASRSIGESSRAAFTSSLLSSGSSHSGRSPGATSFADRLTSPAATIVDPVINDDSVLVITLPRPDTVTATTPEAETPTDRARMTFDDSENTVRLESVVRIESVMAARVVFVMSFTTRGTVTATVPLAATPTTRASMLDEFRAASDTAPPASTVDLVIVAAVSSTITLAAISAWTATTPEAPTPVAKA